MNYLEIDNLIKSCINEDVSYTAKPIELQNQRIFAIKVNPLGAFSMHVDLADHHEAGVNSFLDVARQTYKELSEDINRYFYELKGMPF